MDSFLLKKIYDENARGKSAVLVTVLNGNKDLMIYEGEIFVLLEKDIIVGNISNMDIERASTQIASKLIKSGESMKLFYKDGKFLEEGVEGSIALYFKVFKPKKHLIFIGYSPFIQKVLNVINLLNFEITVISEEQIKETDCCKEFIHGNIEKIIEKLEFEEHTYFVIDQEDNNKLEGILKYILKRNFDYLGLRLTYESIKKLDLDQKKIEFNKHKIYAPFYYNLKYKTDGERVVALLAQIIDVKNKS